MIAIEEHTKHEINIITPTKTVIIYYINHI